MSKPTTSKSRRKAPSKSAPKKKPKKPYDGFPMFGHATGRWAKKIRGKLHYFGKIADDPEGAQALQRLNAELPYLSKGRTPPPVADAAAATVADLCDHFRNAKRMALESGELTAWSYADYVRTCDLVVAHFGAGRPLDDLRADDFQRLRATMSKRWGAGTLKNELNRVRIVLKYGRDVGLTPRELHRDPALRPPAAKALRKIRNERGPLLFTAEELTRILAEADVSLQAMVLLAVNGGLGNSDLSNMPQSAIDWEGGWLSYPRPKTEIQRRIPLWPETLAAIKAALAERPEAADPADEELCFLTREGRRLVRMTPKAGAVDEFVHRDSLGERFRKLLKRLKINGRRGLGFYTCRRVFETIGGESRDQVAVDSIMGHADPSMAAIYRQGVSDERLRAVVETVRLWLWPPATKLEPADAEAAAE